MKLSRRHMLVLLPAAAVAWKSVLAGTPEQAPNYKMSEHWWGMLIDIPKCIGCGNCVRACQAENDVPDGFFRTWVERYHVSDEDMTNPQVISPDGGKEGFPVAKEDAGKYFFVPKMCNHCSDSPCTQVCPVGATFVGPDGQPVSYDDPKHFCRSCHSYASVSIDCFECHASKPEPEKAAEIPRADDDRDLTMLNDYLRGGRP